MLQAEMFPIISSCPQTKLECVLHRLHFDDNAADDWLMAFGLRTNTTTLLLKYRAVIKIKPVTSYRCVGSGKHDARKRR